MNVKLMTHGADYGIHKGLSLLIGIIYLGLSIWMGNKSIVLKTLVFLTFAVSCIWFPRALGMPARLFRTATATPEPFVVLAGWTLLLLPAIIAIPLYFLS